MNPQVNFAVRWQRLLMRKMTLVLNSIIVIFFACFATYTFAARSHLDSLARQFVIEKTLEYAEPVVEAAREAIDSPLAKKLLSDEKEAAIRQEIADYRDDPHAYIANLTGPHRIDEPRAKPKPLLEKVALIKNQIRKFYDKTLNALIADLRIFSISNVVAGLIALGLAYWSSSEIRRPIVWFSFLMFFGVILCSYLYVDDLTFFRILFRTHMGWWYPAFLFTVIVALYRDFGEIKRSQDSIQSHNLRTSRH